jgi:hypothetical protein
MNHRTLPTLLLFLCVTFASGALVAQADIARVYQFKPKQGMSAGFQSAFSQHVEWRKQNGETWNWSTFEVINGDEVGTFIVRSGSHTWPDFDAYDAGFGPRGSENFSATVLPLVDWYTNSIASTDTTNVRWPEVDPGFLLFQTVTYHLKPDHMQQFWQGIGKFHQAIEQTDYPVNYAFTIPENGGKGPTVTLVLPYKSWAEFAGPDQPMDAMMVEVYGEEEAMAIFTEFASCYTAVESAVLRFRPELSVILESGM